MTIVLTSFVFPALTAILTVICARWLERRKAGDNAEIQEQLRRDAKVFDDQKSAIEELVVLAGRVRESARLAIHSLNQRWWLEHNGHLRQMYGHQRALSDVLINRGGVLPTSASTVARELMGLVADLASHASAEGEILPEYASPNQAYLDQLLSSSQAIDRLTSHVTGVMHTLLGVGEKPAARFVINDRRAQGARSQP